MSSVSDTFVRTSAQPWGSTYICLPNLPAAASREYCGKWVRKGKILGRMSVAYSLSTVVAAQSSIATRLRVEIRTALDNVDSIHSTHFSASSSSALFEMSLDSSLNQSASSPANSSKSDRKSTRLN